MKGRPWPVILSRIVADLHPIEASALHARRERVFLVLAGLFLGTLAMLNILGVTRFLDFSFTIGDRNGEGGLTIPFVLAVGVLPYPITFLCTDFISELYGRRRANFVVLVGLLVNLWVLFIIWLGGVLPPVPALGADGQRVGHAHRPPDLRVAGGELIAIVLLRGEADLEDGQPGVHRQGHQQVIVGGAQQGDPADRARFEPVEVIGRRPQVAVGRRSGGPLQRIAGREPGVGPGAPAPQQQRRQG